VGLGLGSAAEGRNQWACQAVGPANAEPVHASFQAHDVPGSGWLGFATPNYWVCLEAGDWA
jgi:hypothetical protein